MIRFFCSSCNKIKRFRKWPDIITNKHLLDPSKRIGKCDSHMDSSRSLYNKTINPRVRNIRVKPVKVVDIPKRVRRLA